MERRLIESAHVGRGAIQTGTRDIRSRTYSLTTVSADYSSARFVTSRKRFLTDTTVSRRSTPLIVTDNSHDVQDQYLISSRYQLFSPAPTKLPYLPVPFYTILQDSLVRIFSSQSPSTCYGRTQIESREKSFGIYLPHATSPSC